MADDLSDDRHNADTGSNADRPLPREQRVLPHRVKLVLHKAQHRIIHEAARNERDESREQKHRRGRFRDLRGNLAVSRRKARHHDEQIEHTLNMIFQQKVKSPAEHAVDRGRNDLVARHVHQKAVADGGKQRRE